jgi:hypothetical protein
MLGELWFGVAMVKGASYGGGREKIAMRAPGRFFYRARST